MKKNWRVEILEWSKVELSEGESVALIESMNSGMGKPELVDALKRWLAKSGKHLRVVK